ncbi:MAG: diguanylate cyclase [Acidobacteriota bacterium]
MHAEPLYVEKVDSYLTDQFHQGLMEVTEGLWSDVMNGVWYCHLEFFKSLHSQFDQMVELRSKPSQLRGYLDHLNFSGHPGSQGGLRAEYVNSWMPIWRQRIFFLNAVHLILKHRVAENRELDFLLSIVKQSLHQQIVTVFSFLETDLGKGVFVSLTNHLESLIETRAKVAFLVNTMTTSLQRYGFDSNEAGDWYKQRVLFRTHAMQPRFNEAFKDWGTQRSFNILHQEIERLLALVYLEGLTHKRGHSLDGLTGLPDRKSFDVEIQSRIIRFAVDRRTLVCGMLDVDDFKTKINDIHGHPAGDFVLKTVADFLRSMLGSGDFAARYGGDEFVILLENVTLSQAEERMAALSRLGDLTFDYEGKQFQFTVSLGLAECVLNDDVPSLINRADRKLYEVKRQRKNPMQERIRAVVNEGRIEPLEKLDMPDGTEVLVTALSNGADFWLKASEPSIKAVWDNPEDDVYAELLER